MRTIFRKPNTLLMLLSLMCCLALIGGREASASPNISTLSTDQNYSLTEQELSVEITRRLLVLDIDWKKTRPITFSKKHKENYIDFFARLISNWDAYTRKTEKLGTNTTGLGHLPTQRGGIIDIVYFRKFADGRDFPDGVSRVRMIHCQSVNSGCMGSQVHFYTRQQIAQILDLLTRTFQN